MNLQCQHKVFDYNLLYEAFDTQLKQKWSMALWHIIFVHIAQIDALSLNKESEEHGNLLKTTMTLCAQNAHEIFPLTFRLKKILLLLTLLVSMGNELQSTDVVGKTFLNILLKDHLPAHNKQKSDNVFCVINNNEGLEGRRGQLVVALTIPLYQISTQSDQQFGSYHVRKNVHTYIQAEVLRGPQNAPPTTFTILSPSISGGRESKNKRN
ncbi:hypothetical protein NQ317_019866 [Molorchus minor]|uniref:Uncharacterized protein n=1 Tax=Molorchus minor TaxID=1323400 RepID=A0ABQ9ITU1_9CUCU|nr:hypothetical protein NQ317_019866 [Molorchus minor]